jgi:crossover junction endodeoxyribonuclease RuvC
VSRRIAWLGIDPGMSGAFALYVPEVTVIVADMPRLPADESTLDHWEIADTLYLWANQYDVRGATIEKVHAIPSYMNKGKRQGISTAASFTFGDAFGAVKQAVASAGLHFTLVPPATWKLLYGLRGGKENKHMSRTKAGELFPEHKELFKRVKDDGRAEAALLAHYGSKLT